MPDFLSKMLEDIARREGFINYKVETEAGSNQGDNVVGVLTSVKVVGDRQRDGVVLNETLHLMCKVAPQSKERRDAFQVDLSFEREIEMYTRVLPVLIDFQKERGLAPEDSFLSIPKVYASDVDRVNERYALIMEDLRSRNFVMWPKNAPVPLSHEKLLLTQLGRFHGVSFALKDQRPAIFNEFKTLSDNFVNVLEKGTMEGLVEGAFDRAIAVVKDETHKSIVVDIRQNYLQLMKDSLNAEESERFAVINHGDCWINNFLFQYDDSSKKLRNISFLDWQNGRYASPALDILYHVFSSTRKELRDESYTDLLHIYHTSLSETVRKLGSDPDKLFRYSDMIAELKAHGKFALVTGIMVVAYLLAEPDDICDIDDFTSRVASGDEAHAFKSCAANSDEYVKVVNDLISDVIAYGYNH